MTHAIEAEGIRKTYELGETASLTRTVRAVRDRLTGRREPHATMCALDGVSFSIRQGECFALMGPNGSGKSTLLNVLCGITVPDEGRAIVRGRVTPLLNVGSGFHVELTGRENVILFGTILGLPRQEILRQLDRVAEFAEISAKQMATPLKRYSSGMKARLTFSTGLCLPSDIFFFDEVLAVADDHFKQLCHDELERLAAGGKTIVFVSHELSQVRRLCDRAIWLERGRVKMSGAIDELADAYAESEQTAGVA
jgi:ABC-type polysaccharide/polyol phosphate transport system ATPase subunit